MIDAAMLRSGERADRRWHCLVLGAFGIVALLFCVIATDAHASLGYEPASPSTISVPGEEPQGIAIDQSSQNLYVAIPLTHLSANANEVKLGQIDQLSASGVPTASSPFAAEQGRVFSSVAVNPVTHDVYAAETAVTTPIGTFGTAGLLDQFSSSGSPGVHFSTGGQVNEGPRIATDSSGHVFVPLGAAHAVRVYDSSGTLLETITCGSCPWGAFEMPTGVALDSANNLYVVDFEDDRVVKFTRTGGSYTYASLLQSGQDAVAVAVDPSTDSVFVGDYPAGSGYHIVAYGSSGIRFDDFGADLFSSAGFGGAPAFGQLAVNATTHRLYASDPGADILRVFNLVTINPPTVTTSAASPVGQIEATVKAVVNANFHATTDCHFEYVDDSSFQANGYTGSSQVSCPSLPDGSGDTSIKAAASFQPGTKYHYRAVATNDAGTTTGNDQVFTTLPTTPATVTMEAPSNVTRTTARLKGAVNPHGGTVSGCQIKYGSTQAYGKTASCSTAIGIVDSNVAESALVIGLSQATSYHYSLTVTTNAGTVHGEDVEFTTLASPPEEPAPEGPTGGGGGGAPAPPLLPAPIVSTPTPSVTPKRLHCRKGFTKRRVRGKLRCVKKKVRKHKRATR